MGRKSRPVNQNDGISDIEARIPKRSSSLKNRSAASNKVFNNEASLVLVENSFNGFPSAVRFDLLAAHEHGDVVGDGDDGGDGERGVRDAADDVKGWRRRGGADGGD